MLVAPITCQHLRKISEIWEYNDDVEMFKLGIPHYYYGDFELEYYAGCAFDFLNDLKGRLAHRVQLTTDGHRMYLETIEQAFGSEIDFAQLVKLYGQELETEKRYSPAKCIGAEKHVVQGNPDITKISTSYVERLNLTYRKLRRASLTGVQGIAGEQSFYQEEAFIMFREEDSTTYLFSVGAHIPKKADSGHDRELQRRLPFILGRDIINQCNLTVNYQRGPIELIPPEGAKRPMPTRRLL
jgi:hypothetical protein